MGVTTPDKANLPRAQRNPRITTFHPKSSFHHRQKLMKAVPVPTRLPPRRIVPSPVMGYFHPQVVRMDSHRPQTHGRPPQALVGGKGFGIAGFLNRNRLDNHGHTTNTVPTIPPSRKKPDYPPTGFGPRTQASRKE